MIHVWSPVRQNFDHNPAVIVLRTPRLLSKKKTSYMSVIMNLWFMDPLSLTVAMPTSTWTVKCSVFSAEITAPIHLSSPTTILKTKMALFCALFSEDTLANYVAPVVAWHIPSGLVRIGHPAITRWEQLQKRRTSPFIIYNFSSTSKYFILIQSHLLLYISFLYYFLKYIYC